jgi:hypothetical protein
MSGAVCVDTIRFAEVDVFPPLGEIEHGELFSLSLSSRTTAFTHGLHRFAAKYIPQVPAWALDSFTPRGGVVVDPFMGSGTTLVEGLLRGGTTVGVDIDPLARFLARADRRSGPGSGRPLAGAGPHPAAAHARHRELRSLVQPGPVGLGAVAAGGDPAARLQ